MVPFVIMVPVPTAFLLLLLLLLGGGKDAMYPTVPFTLPAAFPKLLTDTPCVGR